VDKFDIQNCSRYIYKKITNMRCICTRWLFLSFSANALKISHFHMNWSRAILKLNFYDNIHSSMNYGYAKFYFFQKSEVCFWKKSPFPTFGPFPSDMHLDNRGKTDHFVIIRRYLLACSIFQVCSCHVCVGDIRRAW
jgi:hypothetical protein